MNNSINNIRYSQPNLTAAKPQSGKKNFAGALANGALDTVATVSSVVPGGQIVAAAAKGLQALTGGGNSQSDQMDKMWEMQRENQAFNMEYMELQQQMQADNRHFSTLSNLLKARHDTAKAAINNMQV